MERGIPAHVGRLIVSQIAAFDRACAHAEYTDTDEAWAVLNTITQELQAAMHPEPLDMPELTVKVGELEPNVEEEAGSSYLASLEINGVLHHLTLFPVHDVPYDAAEHDGWTRQVSLLGDYEDTLDGLLHIEEVSAFETIQGSTHEYVAYITPAAR